MNVGDAQSFSELFGYVINFTISFVSRILSIQILGIPLFVYILVGAVVSLIGYIIFGES